jgi:hypothetical protein
MKNQPTATLSPNPDNLINRIRVALRFLKAAKEIMLTGQTKLDVRMTPNEKS